MRYKRSCAVRSCDAFEAVKLNSNLTREGKSICRSDSRYHNDSFDHHVLNCVTWRDFVLIKSTTAIFLPATVSLSLHCPKSLSGHTPGRRVLSVLNPFDGEWSGAAIVSFLTAYCVYCTGIHREIHASCTRQQAGDGG